MKAHASSAEREWIDALAVRYTNDAKADRKLLDAAFAEAMGKIWKAHPDDLDAGVFYAEALMDTQPWDYWEANGKTPKGNGAEIVATLEAIIKKAPEHPGALHLYIHAVEASTTPERAEAAADKLLSLMPEAGHIVHMPSHIYYRVGRYADSVRANEQAAMIDEAYVAACKAQGFYPVGYYGHNIHFLWTSSEMEGRYQAAIDAARRLVKTIDVNGLATAMPLAELYGFTPVTTLLRFGKWDEVLAGEAMDHYVARAHELFNRIPRARVTTETAAAGKAANVGVRGPLACNTAHSAARVSSAGPGPGPGPGPPGAGGPRRATRTP